MDTPDPYALLGVADDADVTTIRKAYKAKAFSCHPDVNPEDAAAATRFAALSEAFAVLADPRRRAALDRLRRAVSRIPDGVPGQPQGRRGGEAVFVPPPQRARRDGVDVRRTIDIPAAVASRGGHFSFEARMFGPCPHCGGTGYEPRACWVCDGRGTIRNPVGSLIVTEPCPACAGVGVHKAPCPSCLGLGERFGPRRMTVVVAPGTVSGDALVVPGGGEPGRGGGRDGDLVLVARVLAGDAGEIL